jgi:hypothetical protein
MKVFCSTQTALAVALTRRSLRAHSTLQRLADAIVADGASGEVAEVATDNRLERARAGVAAPGTVVAKWIDEGETTANGGAQLEDRHHRCLRMDPLEIRGASHRL